MSLTIVRQASDAPAFRVYVAQDQDGQYLQIRVAADVDHTPALDWLAVAEQKYAQGAVELVSLMRTVTVRAGDFMGGSGH